MKYRVRIDLAFDDITTAQEFFEGVKLFYNKARDIKTNFIHEPRRIIIEECHHDEDPPKPCKILKEIKSVDLKL